MEKPHEYEIYDGWHLVGWVDASNIEEAKAIAQRGFQKDSLTIKQIETIGHRRDREDYYAHVEPRADGRVEN